MITTWATSGGGSCCRENRRLVADKLAAAAGENRREAGQARPLLLAVAGRKSLHAAAVWEHAAQDRGAADAIGLAPIAVTTSGAEGGRSAQCLRNRLRGNKRGASDGQERAVGTPKPRWGLLWSYNS